MPRTADVIATPSCSSAPHQDRLDELFSLLSELSKMLHGLNSEALSLVRHDINCFRTMTQDLHSQKNWQGYSTLSFTSLGASLAILGSLLHKNSLPYESARINALVDALGGSKFLRTTASTASKFFGGVAPVSDLWHSSKSSGIESKRSLKQLSFQEGQQEAAALHSIIAKIEAAIFDILKAYAKTMG